MELITVQEGFSKKIKRQQELAAYSDKAQFHCGGNCFHIGEVSAGCRMCFSAYENFFNWQLQLGEDVGLPNVCQFDCAPCFPYNVKQVSNQYTVPSDWEIKWEWKEKIKNWYNGKRRLDFLLYTFTGSESEPLFYLPCIEQFMDFYINEIEAIDNRRGYSKVYTNGVLLNDENIRRLKDARIDELRVNVSASGFSKDVYKNMKNAVKHIPVMTVEVPLWPYYRKGLFEMLPIINDIGVKHLDLCVVEIWYKKHLEKMSKVLPDNAKYFQVEDMMCLDDDGLCEILMKEVIDKNYDYSVIDCNAFVKMVYNGKAYNTNEITFDIEPFYKPDFIK
jgi:pyruvate formate-lyase activating enzyme-like uncharacterized protein